MKTQPNTRPKQTGERQEEKSSGEWGKHPKVGLSVALVKANRAAPDDATLREIATVALRIDRDGLAAANAWGEVA